MNKGHSPYPPSLLPRTSPQKIGKKAPVTTLGAHHPAKALIRFYSLRLIPCGVNLLQLFSLPFLICDILIIGTVFTSQTPFTIK